MAPAVEAAEKRGDVFQAGGIKRAAPARLRPPSGSSAAATRQAAPLEIGIGPAELGPFVGQKPIQQVRPRRSLRPQREQIDQRAGGRWQPRWIARCMLSDRPWLCCECRHSGAARLSARSPLDRSGTAALSNLTKMRLPASTKRGKWPSIESAARTAVLGGTRALSLASRQAATVQRS